MISATGPRGDTTAYGYAEQSQRPNAITEPGPDRRPMRIERDARGLPTRIVDPRNIGGQPTEIVYNDANQPIQTTDALGRVTTYAYNADHDLIRITRSLDGQPVHVEFGYQDGYLQTITDPMGHAVTLGRDHLGRVNQVADPTGVTTSIDHDALGRMTAYNDPRLETPVRYFYDDYDAIVRIATPSGDVTFDYTPGDHRLAQVTAPNGRQTRMAHDPDTGDLIRITGVDPDGPDPIIHLAYDRLGHLARLTAPEGDEMIFTCNELGQLVEFATRDRLTPAPPVILVGDATSDGVWTMETDHTFTWADPETDIGVAGYSFALDARPDTTVDTIVGRAEFKDMTLGQHAFYVRVQTTDGDWSEASRFDLWIRDATGAVFVQPAAAGGRCGSRAPCLARIQEAIAAAPAGAVIRIAEGRYAEKVVIDRPVILQPGWNAAFTASDPSGPIVITGPGF